MWFHGGKITPHPKKKIAFSVKSPIFSDQSLHTSSMLGFWPVTMTGIFKPATSRQLRTKEGFPIEHDLKTPPPIQAIIGRIQYLSKL